MLTKQCKVMLGMVGNKVEKVKFIGRRDMNMDTNIKQIFDKSDQYYRPYFNDAKELFRMLNSFQGNDR